MQIPLYDGSIVLDFDEARHRYTIAGKKVDGVTSILHMINKPALIGWAVRTDLAHLKESLLASPKITHSDLDELIKESSKKHDTIKTVSAGFGTSVHKYIENYIKGIEQEEPKDPEVKRVTGLFISWAKENVLEFRDSERMVYSRKNKYCGTLDFTCFLKGGGGIYVGDLKTTGHIYPEYFLQTAAYMDAYREETGTNVEGRIIIRLKDTIEVAITKDRTKDSGAFKAVLKAYRRLNELGAKGF